MNNKPERSKVAILTCKGLKGTLSKTEVSTFITTVKGTGGK